MKMLHSVVVAVLLLVGISTHAQSLPMRVEPGVVDPVNSQMVTARWINGLGCPVSEPYANWVNYPNGSGSPRLPIPVPSGVTVAGSYTESACSSSSDSNDFFNQGLLLAKEGDSANSYSAAVAYVHNVYGITLTELGFDIRNGSFCGGGAPSFLIVMTDGTHKTNGCEHFTGISGLSSSPDFAGNGWVRGRADLTALYDPNNGNPFPITSGATVISITIVLESGTSECDRFGVCSGMAILDNIDVNGTLIGHGNE